LAGAFTVEFEYASNTMLLIGDAAGINGDGLIQKVMADIAVGEEEQIPSIGIVAEFIEGSRMARVAIGGAVSGFKHLQTGRRYYLADSAWELSVMLENENSSTTEGMILSSLMPAAPADYGEMIQVMGIARSATEILIMPSLDYTVVDNVTPLAAEKVINNYNYIINDSTGNQSDENTDNSTASEEIEIPATEDAVEDGASDNVDSQDQVEESAPGGTMENMENTESTESEQEVAAEETAVETPAETVEETAREQTVETAPEAPAVESASEAVVELVVEE